MNKHFCNYENSLELFELKCKEFNGTIRVSDNRFIENDIPLYLHSQAIDFLLEQLPIKGDYSVKQSCVYDYYLVKSGYDQIETHFTTKDELISHIIKLVKNDR